MDKTENSASDISLTGLWARLPASWQPFILLARFDRPVGWWLLLLPGWFSIAALAADLTAALWLMGLFWMGAVVMRGAGCVINDLWDRQIDRQIARTARRPLASRTVSVKAALLFCAGLIGIGLVILVQLPWQSWLVGLAAAPLILIYPLAKRVIGVPQAVLGLVFSWAALLGPVAARASWPEFPALWLWIGSVFWVIGYDTIYAVQDMADDRLTGVRSSALTFGKWLRAGVGLCYLLALAGWAAGFFGLLGSGVWLIGWLAAGLHLFWQVIRLDPDNPQLAGDLFRSNRNTGLVITAAVLARFLV